MALSINLEQPKEVTSLKDDPDKAQADINRAIQIIMQNLELIRQKSQEA